MPAAPPNTAAVTVSKFIATPLPVSCAVPVVIVVFLTLINKSCTACPVMFDKSIAIAQI